MAHNHDHSHSHAASVSASNKNAFLWGIGLNLLFVVTEIVFGILNNSMALLTDAGHNASDVASLVLSLVAFWMAKKNSTATFTYGYKKTTVLAALINAVVLLVAIGILGYESFTRLFNPKAVAGETVAWVAGVGIAVNGLSAYFFFRHKNNELNAKSAYLHLVADAVVSLGVVIAGLVINYTHWYWLDPAIGLVIMVVILASTWSLLRDSFKMSIDAVPTGIDLETIKKVIRNVPHIQQVHHVHVWPLSTTENALTAQVVVDDELNFDEKIKAVEKIKHELLHHNVHHSTIELTTN